MKNKDFPPSPRWLGWRLRHAFWASAACAVLAGCATVKPAPKINTYVVLLPEEGGAPTSVIVGEGAHVLTLDPPFSGATVDSEGKIERKSPTAAEADKTFGAALAAQPPKPISFTLYFDTNSTQVTTASRPQLDALMAEAARRQAVEVQVTGHTDRVGNAADNDRLSLQRAETMRTMLVQNGIKATFIRAVGRGEREPLVPTADEQPEARNRRVEVLLR
ncbi:MAG TPA: OmpA family protein [Candidatus Deferrimicrobium sp.]|nr:OmpA family protein [Candidatus Deferrimicrobium sp.]